MRRLAEAVAGAAGMEVAGATGSNAAFAADPEEEVEPFAGDALAVDALLLLLFDALFDALDFDALDFDEDDFFEEDFAAVFFEVAAAASDGNTTSPASVDTSATTRSAVRTRMGRRASKSNAVESCQRMHRGDSPDEFRQSHLCSRMRTGAHVAAP